MGILIRKRLTAASGLSLAILAPTVASACPYCAGSDGGQYLSTIAIPILTLLSAPLVIFFVGAAIVWYHDKDSSKVDGESDRDSRSRNSGSAPAGQS